MTSPSLQPGSARSSSPASRCLRPALASSVLLLAVTCASTASANPSLADKATAEALFEDGLQLMGAKRFAEACPKLEESERLDPALGTRFRLSECEEAVGRLASAWAGFLEVADLAHAAKQTDRETVARARAATIEPRLSRVRVDVTTPEVPGLEVAHDHVVVGKGQWGTPVPIDAGTYTLTATAPNKAPWRGSITVAQDGVTAVITVPALTDAAVAATGPAPLVVGSVVTPEAHASRAKVAGASLIAVGAAGIVTSGVLGLVARSKYDDAGSNCTASACNAAGEGAITSARQVADVATGVFIVGAAAAVAGTVLVLTAPSTSRHGAASARLRLGPDAAFLEGSF